MEEPGEDHAACGHGHLVEFYETDAFLAATVTDFLSEGLSGSAATIVVATEAHREAFLGALRERGVDVDRALLTSRLVVLDARETLDEFMVAGGPDPARFRAAITAIMDRAGAGWRSLRVYGEMVAVLWADGKVASAIALEDLWNDLAGERDFMLLCAYPMSAFDDPAHAAAFARVCEQHTSVIPSEGYTDLPQRRAGEERALALAQRLAMSLREGDAAAASAVLDDGLADDVAAAALIARVVAPAMHAIGGWWADGTLTVADEHLATATCERVLAGLYPSLLTHRPRSRERVLVAGVEGEAHAIAPRVVADVLEGRGYDVVYLGPDVPADMLASAARRHSPELVALSLTMASGAAALGRCIAAVQSARPDTLFLLGGQGIDRQWASVGYPVAGSAEEAPRTVETLLRERPEIPCAPPDRRLLAPVLPAERDRIEQLASIATDLGALARSNALNAHHYRFLALDDPLTGLPNRRAFDAYLGQTIESGKRVTILLVDIDQFKEINDRYGHEAGDALLIEIGRAIAGELRPGDVVARLGGDEFGVLLRDGNSSAEAVAERIRAAVQQRCLTRHATVSVGAAKCDGDQFVATLEADRALYIAKAHGRNTVTFAPSARSPDQWPRGW